MHVWLVTVGEPLPVLSGNSRLWRTGMVAQELIRRGHSVVWWASRVDHFRKEFFTALGPSFEPYAGLTIRLLEGDLYRRNVSVTRLINHWQIGRNFARESRNMPPPDLILCSFPTIELSLAAVRLARERGIPIVLDVRDLWPDIFLQPAPRWLRGTVRALLWPYFAATRRALSGADAIIAVSDGYLEWGLAGAGRAGRPPDRVYPLAYDLPEQMSSARAAGLEMFRSFGVKSDCIVCLFAGTLGRTYDLAPVLECATGLAHNTRSRFHFVICGDGERAREWRKRAADLPNVTFTGWLEQDAMRAALAAADIGLAAYAQAAPQGLPNKIIEYLAAGLPVISSLSGETEQLLSSSICGMTYVAGSATSFGEALRALEPAEVRDRAARHARNTFEARFDAEIVYGRLAEHLEVLARPD